MTTAEILAGFTKVAALVVGDICLDRWCTYDPSTAEPSRETGIPRIGVVATEVTPGGGGTVANNLAALGAARITVLGVVGEDGFGFELRRALSVAKAVSAGRRNVSTYMVNLLFFLAENLSAVWFGPLFMGLRFESEIGPNFLPAGSD